ncbi:MAG TPA: cytochrome c oxidase subunit 3 [Alphaproteobacteria bacterium]|nr:cytochrome c oxidase subunit 3 [Alphaproteobacteria bacterium]
MHTPQVAHYERYSRLFINRLGLWLFIVSESFLFAALLASRYYLLGVYRPHELNQPLGLVISVVLLASSLSAYRAEMSAAYDDQRGLRSNLLATIGLGALFLVGVAIEWYEAFHYFPPDTAYGTIFFTLTGTHAFHVFSGMLVLLLVYLQARRGRFNAKNYWGVEGAVKYWHFVDVAWVFIYPTLYLVS